MSDKKGYIHFWCRMTPYRSKVTPVWVEGGDAFFNPYFYIPKHGSSDALPALEIFLVFFFIQLVIAPISLY